MKLYAVLFGVLTLVSVCFIDNNIQPMIAKVGRVSLAVCGVLFIVTEAIYLFTS